MQPLIIVLAHNVRSTHNVGSIFRTCEGLGVEKLILSGYTPYPTIENDSRLPHIRQRLSSQIRKTALGAEDLVPFTHADDPHELLATYRQQGFTIVGLEQTPKSTGLANYQPPRKLVLILGEEVEGIPEWLQQQCDVLLEIPMQGHKESFNVSVAAGIALYALRHHR